MRLKVWLWVAVALAATACGPGAVDQDAGVDAGLPGTTNDAGVDAGAKDGGAQDAGADGGADAGLDAGMGGDAGCDRASQTRTADIALLDQLRVEVAAATSPQQLDALTAAFFDAVVSQGGTPLTSANGDRVAFVARDAPQNGYSVAGTWNNWTPGVDTLSRVGQSQVYAVEKTLPRTQAYEYKMLDGASWYEDRRARHVAWDGIDHQGVGEFNAVVYPEKRDPSKGRLVAWRGVPSAVLGDARDVFIYVPATYDQASCPVIPSMYFHDGNESLTRAPFTEPADQTYQAYPGEAAVLVFVALPTQTVRMSQYTFGTSTSTGDKYLQFLRDELRPKIEAAFRVCPGARDRGLAGASLGGLISGYGAFQHPGTWGYVGSQSGSYFWENDALIGMVQGAPKKNIRWYVDHGCPGDNCVSNNDLVAVLSQKGYEHKHIEEQGGQHDWAYWKKRLPGLLRYFREGRSGCE